MFDDEAPQNTTTNSALPEIAEAGDDLIQNSSSNNPPTFKSDLEEDIYETLKIIKDPEFPSRTLGDLDVITPQSVVVDETSSSQRNIHITFKPTVKHCSMASIIGLCIRKKLELEFGCLEYKIDISLAEDSHDDIRGVMKQINDKERVYAAFENPNVSQIVENSIAEDI